MKPAVKELASYVMELGQQFPRPAQPVVAGSAPNWEHPAFRKYLDEWHAIDAQILSLRKQKQKELAAKYQLDEEDDDTGYFPGYYADISYSIQEVESG
jgi:hypothetical protein